MDPQIDFDNGLHVRAYGNRAGNTVAQGHGYPSVAALLSEVETR